MRVVVCAANECEGKIVLGVRHFDKLMCDQIESLGRNGWNPMPEKWRQGFIDQHGVFMDRVEALEVAINAGQVNTRRPKGQPENILFSEDLY